MALVTGSLSAAPKDRILRAIDNSRRTSMMGHVNPRTTLDVDEGPVDPAQPIRRMMLVLRPSDEQQAELDRLLAAQQDPSSPEYHHWLTPEEFGERFGASEADLVKVRAWLESEHLTVHEVARGRNAIRFSGTAAAVESAFRTELRYYRDATRRNYANRTEPSLPAAVAPVVLGIRGLNNFRLKPPARVHPKFNTWNGAHQIGPDDFSLIYNLNPLYVSGFDGTGQKIAVVGQTNVNLKDISDFRSYFGLSAKAPQMLLIPGSADPGIIDDDLAEADLDIEWAGAVARNATIVFVYSEQVDDALQYAIDHNVAPVLSMSYGLCEYYAKAATANLWRSWAQQANSQGITWFAAGGDNGATDCYDGPSTNTYGLVNVDLPASIPEVTGVGGTQFSDASGNYWNFSNIGTGKRSALSYIPEESWNESTTYSIAATGGGYSTIFSKPSWQTGNGVSSTNARQVPDVAVAGASGHDAYAFWSDGQLSSVGGTSAGAPAWAGITAILNQALVAQGMMSKPGFGNLNPKLYTIGQGNTGAFHDILNGSNIISVFCSSRASATFCKNGTYGYAATPGYDLNTGWGTPNAAQLAIAMGVPSSAIAKNPVTVGVSANPASIYPGNSTVVTVNVRADNNGLPTGTITLTSGGVTLGTGTLISGGDSATISIAVSSTKLGTGANTINAQYSGDATYSSATGTGTVTLVSLQSAITSPTPGSQISGSSVLFLFTQIQGATLYRLQVGSTAGAGDLYQQDTASTSLTVSGLPTDGRTLYVQLSTFVNGSWQSPNAYTYAAYQPPVALRFVPLAPCRVVDTRNPAGALGGPTLGANSSRSFPLLSSACGIPANVRAYSLNVTAVPTNGAIPYLTIWPTGQPQPFVSTLNSDGRVKSNAALVAAGTGGAVSVYVANSAEVILDITGVFVSASSNAGLAFYPVTPCRVADTRVAGGQIAANSTRNFNVSASFCGIPATAQAYSLNFTAVPQSKLGYLTTWPTGQPQPFVSTLGSPTGTVVANAALLAAGTSGAISAYVTDRTDLVIDINGYFAPAGGANALSFYAMSPCRISDTRNATGTFGGPSLAAPGTRSIPVTSSACSVPSTSRAYALNATVVPSGVLGYLTLWPADTTRPTVSTLNALDGAITANAALVPASTAGAITAYAEGVTDLILDINGYFAP